jgi:lysine-N-methylase
MPASIQRAKLVSQFTCLGDKCVDTCCQNWSMQVDEPTLARYRTEAPELLNAVEPGGTEASVIMRKNAGTGLCVKLESGLCGIHKKYGDRMLSDACHFYPRVTRSLGKTVLMTASMSCPEITRLAFSLPDAEILEAATVERLPYGMKDYLPSEFTTESAMTTHQAFLDVVNDATVNPEHIFARIASASRSLERVQKKDWPNAAAFFLKSADARLPEPARLDNDPYNLLLSLAGLVAASQKPPTLRLRQTIEDMENALGAKINWQTLQLDIADDASLRCAQMKKLWQEKCSAQYDAVLRRWLKMQLSIALYPFGGFGETLVDRVTIIGVRFAIFKLALLSACTIQGDVLPEEIPVRIAQSLSRFLDHLADASYSLTIYGETGWTREDRLRGLIESF